MTIALGPLLAPGGALITYEVQGSCKKMREPSACKVTFDKTNNVTVLKFGGSGRGECETNPDIAGIGVLLGMTPNFLLCVFAVRVIFVEILRGCRGKSGVDRERANNGLHLAQKSMSGLVIILISDAATILGLAYYFNFMLSAKCDMSTYHYYIALDIIVFTCSTIVLATLLSHAYYWSSVAAVFRFLLALAHFIFVGLLLFYQGTRTSKLPEWLPPDVSVRNDSAVLLPVSCFLDKDLRDHWSPFRAGWGSAAEKERIGLWFAPAKMPEFVLYVLLLFCFVAIHASSPVRWWHSTRRRRRHDSAAARQVNITASEGWFGACIVGFWLSAVCVCITADVLCAYHTLTLRSWAHASGWMADSPVNPENVVGQLGQLISLFGLGAIVLVMLEHYKWDQVREWMLRMFVRTSGGKGPLRNRESSTPLAFKVQYA